ncbi:MAG: glutaredoxin family protein [Candidatus Bathyarchaeia archaeon]
MKKCPKCKKGMRKEEGLYVCDDCKISYPKTLNPELYGSLRFLLFTTPNCGHCPVAKESMKNLGIEFEEINCNDNWDMVNKFKILSVPCLVIEKNDKFVKLFFAG